MSKFFKLCLVLLVACAAMACKEKKQSDVIIIRKPVTVKESAPRAIGDATRKQSVKWVGADYTITITTKADKSLPLATDGSSKYYDNRVTLSITRSDGSSFYSRTFSKSDFRQYVDNAYYDGGALVSIVFDKVDGNRLKFAACVGNPDKSSDEFMPLDLTISHLGALTISKSEESEE